jgi:pimeloyl-ACP methyl ester carboxylesterase
MFSGRRAILEYYDNKMQNFDPITQEVPNDSEYPAALVPATFQSNGCRILGTMFIASGKGPHPVILLLHGFPGNEINYDLAHIFRRQGFNVFVFHYRGSWGSEGNYLWKQTIEDTEGAIKFLQSDLVKENYRVDGSKIILVGYSMGGFAALYSSIFHDEIKNITFLAGFNAGLFGEIIGNNRGLFQYSAETILPSMDFVKCDSAEILLNEMVENQSEWNLINHVEKLLQKNLLIISAQNDSTAPIEIHHKPLIAALTLAGAKKVEEHVLETSHSFSDKRLEIAKIICAWLGKIDY